MPVDPDDMLPYRARPDVPAHAARLRISRPSPASNRLQEYEFALADDGTLMARLPQFNGPNDWDAREAEGHDNPLLIEAMQRVLRAYDPDRFGFYSEDDE